MRKLFAFALALLLIEGVCSRISFTVKNSFQTVSNGGAVEVECEHDDNSYLYFYWYRQHRELGFTLMGLSIWGNKPSLEEQFTDGYEIISPRIVQSSLKILSAKATDSATYFCAASQGTGGTYEVHFGPGTKLIVLEDGLNITAPDVALFDPSPQEVSDRGLATLVCLVSRFYPDHLTLSWSMNGMERTAGVKTDDSPSQQSDKMYSMTSRLRLPRDEWLNPENTFKCTVYFDPTKTNISKETRGQEGCQGVSPDSYRKSANTAKFTYVLLIAKSAFYGLCVNLLVWNMKRTGAKNCI